MQAVTLHAFCVTVYGNNDNMEKRHDKKKHTDTERMDLFFFILPFLLLRTSSFDQCN